MTSLFLTYHGTLLCFGRGETDFQHVSLGQLHDATLVIGHTDPAALRSGALHEQPLAIRPDRPARTGLPRSIGVRSRDGTARIALDWRGAHLCAGGEGGTILRSEQIAAWEEFLPISSADLAVLQALANGGWERGRDGRRFGPGEIHLGEDFSLIAGGDRFDLSLMPALSDVTALKQGRISLLLEGWRIENFRRFDPAIVWRHDGSDQADEETFLGVRSLFTHGGFEGRVSVETRWPRDIFLDRIGTTGGGSVEVVEPPLGRTGLLHWPLPSVYATAGPILYVANGVVCLGKVEPLLRVLALERDLAVLPWAWTAIAEEERQAALFSDDPAESSQGQACSAAIIGVPGQMMTSDIRALIGAIAAHRLTATPVTDAQEDDLLRYVVARHGGACTRLLSRFAVTRTAAADRGGPPLVNMRPVPGEVRISAMRDILADAT